MTDDALIIQGNALALPLEDATVDLVVTSPPYFALRSYEDGGEYAEGQIGNESGELAYVDALLAATREMMRVLKPTGSIFVNLGDRYGGSTGTNTGTSPKSKIHGHGYGKATVDRMRRASANGAIAVQATDLVPSKSLVGLPWRYAIACVDQLGLILRAEIIWDKANHVPDSRPDRVQRTHEHIFHLVKQPKYYAALDKVRRRAKTSDERTAASRRSTIKSRALRNEQGIQSGAAGASFNSPNGTIPGSVWHISGDPLRLTPDERRIYDLPQHQAPFPTTIPQRCILGWCPRDGVVLDPFGGSGTVAMVARSMGRKAIHVDLSADYCRLAEYRIFGQTKRVNLATM